MRNEGEPGMPVGAGPLIAVCGMAFEAAIASGPGIVTLCGPGGARLASRLDQLLREMPACRGIISFGTAGGLDPGLRPGACVIATAVVSASRRMGVDASWRQALAASLPHAIQGTLAGTDWPLASAAAKAHLRRMSGACIADMESHRAALVAQRHGLPFAACRVVLDPAHAGLPSCAIAGWRDDGTIAVLPVLAALASHPWQCPALLRLASQAAIARRGLRAARAATGPRFALPR